MCGHYQAIKDEDGINDLLQKRTSDQVPDICMPVFMGTDRRALFEIFGHPDGGGGKAKGVLCRGQAGSSCGYSHRPVSARPIGPAARDLNTAGCGPARRIAATPRPSSRSGAATISQNGAVSPRPLSRSDRVASRPSSAASSHQTRVSVGRDSLASSKQSVIRRESTSSSRYQPLVGREPTPATRQSVTGRPSSSSGQRVAVQEAAAKLSYLGYEIVSTLQLPGMLAGAGPYMLPEGPTLQELGPPSLTARMGSLQIRSSGARAKLRLFKPGTQAAAASAQPQSARVSSRSSERPHGLKARFDRSSTRWSSQPSTNSDLPKESSSR